MTNQTDFLDAVQPPIEFIWARPPIATTLDPDLDHPRAGRLTTVTHSTIEPCPLHPAMHRIRRRHIEPHGPTCWECPRIGVIWEQYGTLFGILNGVRHRPPQPKERVNATKKT